MTAAKQIKAQARAKSGKGAARAERRMGRTPAVIYGAGAPAAPFRSIEGHRPAHTRRALPHHHLRGRRRGKIRAGHPA